MEIWRRSGIASSCCLTQPQLWGRKSSSIFHKQLFSIIQLLHASQGYFWPLPASIALEVKKNHGHVKTAGILNKFFEKFFLKDVWFDLDGVTSIKTQTTSINFYSGRDSSVQKIFTNYGNEILRSWVLRFCYL